MSLFSIECFFSAVSTIPQLASRRKKLLNLENGSVSRVPGRHWSSAPSLCATDFDFVRFQRHLTSVFQSLSSTPGKKTPTLYLSSVKSHFFSLPCGSQTEPRHAFTKKGKSAISKLRDTLRQIKALITATILEGGEWLPPLDTRPPPVVLTPHNSGQQHTQVHSKSRCFGYDMCIIMQMMTWKWKTGTFKGSSLSFKCECGIRLHVNMNIFYVNSEI